MGEMIDPMGTIDADGRGELTKTLSPQNIDIRSLHQQSTAFMKGDPFRQLFELSQMHNDINKSQPRAWKSPDRAQLTFAFMKKRQAVLAQYPPGVPKVLFDPGFVKPSRHFSMSKLEDLSPITFSGTMVPKIHSGRYLLCRTVTPACEEAMVTVIVEDADGSVCLVLLDHCRPSLEVDLDVWLPMGTMFAVKEPYVQFVVTREVIVCVDSPSDLVFFHQSNAFLKDTRWYVPLKIDFDECKRLANRHFAEGRMELALDFYDYALERRPGDPVVHLNKAAAFLKQGLFRAAYEAVERAMADQDSIVMTNPSLKYKALFRLGQAAYGIRDWAKSVQAFSQVNDETVCQFLERSQRRLREARSGDFDMQALGTSIGRLVLHDVADFVGDVVVTDIPGKGRGLRTTTNVQAGTLLFASKAFAIANLPKGPFNSNELSVCKLARREMLAGNIIRALRRDPHRASELYQLYAGSFPRVDLPAGIIDPGRILELVSKDSFGIEHEFEVGLRDPMQDVGLWIFPSFVNHSCVENARRIFYGDVMMVRALRDLLAGEEILINYFAFGGDNRLSIGAIWQINCQCPMCQERNRTPQQVAERRESLLDRIIRGSQESRRSSDVETLVRSMEETYSPEDQFREDMAFPLLILMQAYVNDGITEQAIATGRQVLGLSLGLPAGFLVLAHILIARMYTETKRPDLAKAELRTMKDMVWKRARITLSQLTIVANKLIESHDPNGVLMEALRHLEEEESALPP